jgi:F-type H+-transporting ATPase subunit delta
MAEIATIARPYAEAAFQLADGAGALVVWSEALANLARAAETTELQSVLADPLVSDPQRVDTLLAVASGGPEGIRKFLEVLAENKRLAALPAVREQFERLRAAREGTLEARIETAFPLEGEELAGLIARLERRFGQKMRVEVVQDRELVGGARITVGDQVIDGSIRGKLAAIAAGLVGA